MAQSVAHHEPGVAGSTSPNGVYDGQRHRIVEALPKTAVGKIEKKQLRASLQQEGTSSPPKL